MIQIAVLGYGTVGSGVVEVINRNQESINKKAGEEINIKYVLDLRDFPGDPVQEKIVHDYEVIANDPEIKIVVEVMGGTNPAYTFVKRALESGKSVCTSNKELVCETRCRTDPDRKGEKLQLLIRSKLRWRYSDHPAAELFSDRR